MTQKPKIERQSNGRFSIEGGPAIYKSLDDAMASAQTFASKGLSIDDLKVHDEIIVEMNLPGAIQMDEILDCVKNEAWQTFRKSLKGLSTAEKLRKLRSYKRNNSGRCVNVRVENYLNALRRGGQLPPKRR